VRNFAAFIAKRGFTPWDYRGMNYSIMPYQVPNWRGAK